MNPYPAWPFRSDPSHPLASALWALLVHGAIGALVVAPIVWRSRHRIGCGVLAFVGGSALDVDHVIAAGSLSPRALETLPARPDTHSLLFVLGLSLLTAAVWPRLSHSMRGSGAPAGRWLAAWSVFAVNCAHLLFDAAGGNEHILYPWTSVDGIPWLLCPIGTLALTAASLAVATRMPRLAPQREPGV